MARRGKLTIVFAVIVFFIIALATKPSDKTIKIEAIKTIWGNLIPAATLHPTYYEQFMDYTSANVYIDDWVIIKRVRFKIGTKIKPIGYAGFGKVIIRQ